MAVGKRSCDNEIDMFFLVGQNQLVTEKEYYSVIKEPVYSRYLELFYARRTTEVFLKNKTSKWFNRRYLGKETHKFEKPANKKYIFIENDANLLSDEAHHKYMSYSGVENVIYIQKGRDKKYRNELCLCMNDETDLNQFILNEKLENKSRIFNLEDYTWQNDKNSEEIAGKVFNVLSLLGGMDPGIYINELRATSPNMTYTEGLRIAFGYCILCGRQYDSLPEMYEACSKHSNEEPSKEIKRSVELLAQQRDFSVVDDIVLDEKIASYAERQAGGGFFCRKCLIVFMKFNHVIEHFHEDHRETVEELKRDVENFKKFKHRIDCMALDMIESLYDEDTPLFIRNAPKQKEVIYDLPCLYSGEIKM